MLAVGDRAPEFSLCDQSGTVHALGECRGAWALLYFYPKDDTPGCTTEACSVRDNWNVLKNKLKIFGISADSIASHKKFAEKYHLPFPLLADVGRAVVNAYGVGSPSDGIMRTSFLIQPDGVVAKVYEKVQPAVHISEVLTDLIQLQKSS